MGPIRCIIIDDEEGAHLVLEHFLRDINSLVLARTFFNAVEAMDYIYKNPVDLIFLDINMPGLSGMEMLEAMSNPPLVVLTTAHSEFALEGYKYQVVDYLLKPIAFPKFLAAVDKVISRFKPAVVAAPATVDFLMLKVEGDILKVMLNTISHVQSWGNYVKVHTDRGTYLSPATTMEIEEKLDKKYFKRIHKSYIVALDRIERITGAQAHLKNDVVLPIGNTFRRELLDHFRQ
jgi:DNA-binding LytR/AlgR family response regulator